MKIALVDDEEYLLNKLRDAMLCSLAALHIEPDCIDTFTSGEGFLADFAQGKYDIVILDIFMDDLNGISVARRIRKLDTDVALAFCTSSNEFAGETYEVEARYYLNKPISQEKVTAMLSRFNLAKIERDRAVNLPDGSRVPLRRIIYTEYNNHKVTFHLRELPPRSFYMTQGEAEAMLLGHKNFFVVNKGCIVNLTQVESLSGGAFVMENGDTVSISRRRLKDVEGKYTKYQFQRLDSEVSD